MKRRNFCKTVLCLVLLLYGSYALAQENLLKSEYSYRRYTTHDNLHHMMTTTVFQDKAGFLWIGTYKGFARFDGYVFTPFLSETMQSIFRIEDAENGQVRAFGS
jgi:ligand-binding sensor domain-containing protein